VTKEGSMKRKSVRFKPDIGSYALIDVNVRQKAFNPNMQGLIINESYTGCALVVISETAPKTGVYFRIKVGELNPMKAKVAWAKLLEENIYKVGVQFLE
jgi:hypothetical protein